MVVSIIILYSFMNCQPLNYTWLLLIIVRQGFDHSTKSSPITCMILYHIIHLYTVVEEIMMI